MNAGTDKIVAFYLDPDNKTDIENLKLQLFKKLDPTKAPTIFHACAMEEYPKNMNQKVDVRALKELLNSTPELEGEILPPQTELQQKIYDVLRPYANSNFSINKDIRAFIDSLASNDVALALVAQKIVAFDDISSQDILDYYSVEQLANRIENGIQLTDMKKEFCKVASREELETTKVINKPYGANLSGVLLTGSTGYLGAHALHNLIRDKSVEKIYCLVRAKDGQSGFERLVAHYKSYDFEEDITELLGSKIIPFEGEITAKHFNISPELYDEMHNNVTTVLHPAANVKWVVNRDVAYHDNVASVQNIISECLENNWTLAHVSTTSLAGSSDTESKIFDENSFFENRQNIHKSAYLETKAVAEFLIHQAMQKQGLKAKVFRVGNLMPRFKDGKFQINANENGFMSRLKGIAKLKAIPEGFLTSQEVELTPVDLCSEAIISLLKTSDDQTVYHILNNHKFDLSKILGKMDLETISGEEFIKRVVESKDPDVKIFMNYLSMLNSVENKVTCDSTVSKLEALGFKWNEYTRGYQKNLLKFVKCDNDFKPFFNRNKKGRFKIKNTSIKADDTKEEK